LNPTEVLRNQRHFHELNGEIAEVIIQGRRAGAEFLCECGREDCVETIGLDAGQYERIQTLAGIFLVAPGHCVEGVDRLVESRDGYDLVFADL